MSDKGTTPREPTANTSPWRPRVSGMAILGRRSKQEDSFRAEWMSDEKAWLLVLADGMGGHSAGATASGIATQVFHQTFAASRRAGDGIEKAFRAALDASNRKIAETQATSPETSGMGTTVTAAHLAREGLAWISVGDSPLWLHRKGRLTRLNADHSLRAMVPNGGGISGNLLQSAVTGDTIELVDLHPAPERLEAGDVILLASDGLLTLNEREIADNIDANIGRGPEMVAKALLAAVNAHEQPHQDNCSLMVALVTTPAPGSGSAAPSMAEPARVAVLGRESQEEPSGNLPAILVAVALAALAFGIWWLVTG